MIGIPGSGKSTYAKNISNATVISSDEIRHELTGDYSNLTKDKQVFPLLEKRILDLLEAGKDAVYDATNINLTKRRKITAKYSDLAKIVYVFMDTPLKVALERNKKRERKVPEDVIKNMYKYLKKPNIVYDNYDKLIIIKPNGKEEVKYSINK
jgi:predicted kinase